MTQLTRDNHFVPQAYLRRWSDDGKRVYCYRTVVAHKRVPEWEPKSIRGVAYQRDLYTGFANGQEVDDFERWIKSDFEDPAMEALEKVASNAPLGQSDWERLAMFAAAQDMRTPARDDAVGLAIRALRAAMRRDAGSGEWIHVVIITREKYYEVPEDELNQKYAAIIT